MYMVPVLWYFQITSSGKLAPSSNWDGSKQHICKAFLGQRASFPFVVKKTWERREKISKGGREQERDLPKEIHIICIVLPVRQYIPGRAHVDIFLCALHITTSYLQCLETIIVIKSVDKI